MEWFVWLLGLDSSSSIEQTELFLSAPWARQGMFWLFLGVVSAFVVAFYAYWHPAHHGRRISRSTLAVLRGTLLSLLVITFAEPFLRLTTERPVRPLVRLLFDGTESMLTPDIEFHGSQGLAPQGAQRGTRLEAMQQMLRQAADRFASLNCRLEAYQFNGMTTSRLHQLPLDSRDRVGSIQKLADLLVADGQVTALGTVVQDMTQSFPSTNLRAAVLFSDFAHNAGSSPVADQIIREMKALGAPIHTVGVGQTQLVDLRVDLQVESRMKQGEETKLSITLQSNGLDGQRAEVVVVAQLVSPTEDSPADAIEIARQIVELAAQPVEILVPFIPPRTGHWDFSAEALRLAGEHVELNNKSTRRSNVIDDYIRLLYATSEPTWEWRFVKEAFHRDPLVGSEGFRTFLESSDPRVKRENTFFLETLPTQRDVLLTQDILILDDLPESLATEEFCQLVEEFVGTLGGGLVVMAGPRFGIRGLDRHSLSALLPVYPDARAPLRDNHPFAPLRTPRAAAFSFMNLGDPTTTNDKAWANMGMLPWYQPVANVHEQAAVLSEHPTDMCQDGITQQPLLAIRKYGKGEVVFVAFNELWRLRRGHGDKFHRRFWSQLIYRLGMSHALGEEKRFVVRTDREHYQTDEAVTITVEAYDADFLPFQESSVAGGALQARLSSLSPTGSKTQNVTLPWRRAGVFEVQTHVTSPGAHTIEVIDPVSQEVRQAQIMVTSDTAERLDPVRNEQLQTELAQRTGGKSYDLAESSGLFEQLALLPTTIPTEVTRPLWNTPLWFLMVIGLMVFEWVGRRLIHLK